MRPSVRPGLAHAGVAVRCPVADGRKGPALVAGPVGPFPGREPVGLVVASGRNAEPKPRALRADRLGGFVLVGVPAVGVSPKLVKKRGRGSFPETPPVPVLDLARQVDRHRLRCHRAAAGGVE
jgi:hypothetical protein